MVIQDRESRPGLGWGGMQERHPCPQVVLVIVQTPVPRFTHGDLAPERTKAALQPGDPGSPARKATLTLQVRL